MAKQSGPPNRREFLATTSIARIMSDARSEGSKSMFCVDCQSHLFAPEIIDLYGKAEGAPLRLPKGEEIFVVVGE